MLLSLLKLTTTKGCGLFLSRSKLLHGGSVSTIKVKLKEWGPHDLSQLSCLVAVNWGVHFNGHGTESGQDRVEGNVQEHWKTRSLALMWPGISYWRQCRGAMFEATVIFFIS